MIVTNFLDWAGCVLGLLGAYTLALNLRFSRFGWIAFLTANVAYIALAHLLGMRGLFVQQIGFMGSSLLGVYRSFIAHQSLLEISIRTLLQRCASGEVVGVLAKVATRDDGLEVIAAGSFEPAALIARHDAEIVAAARAYVAAHDALNDARGITMQLGDMAHAFDRLRRATAVGASHQAGDVASVH